MVCDRDCVSCSHARIGRVFLPLIASMLFVSINFTLEKAFVSFLTVVDSSCCVIFELN